MWETTCTLLVVMVWVVHKLHEHLLLFIMHCQDGLQHKTREALQLIMREHIMIVMRELFQEKTREHIMIVMRELFQEKTRDITYTYTQPFHLVVMMLQNMSREMKQMQKLMKKLRKDAQQDAGKKQRWVDATVQGGPDAQDLVHQQLFLDMKRREF